MKWKLSAVGGFFALISKGAKSVLRQGLPDKTEIFLAVRNMPAIRKRDLIRLAIPPEEVVKYINELRSDETFYSDFRARMSSAKEAEARLGGIPPIDVLEFIYAIVRHSQPEVIVETGVGGGGTSLFILKAVHVNGRGKLYSIDLPGFSRQFYPTIGKPYDIHVPNGWETGWLVPPELRTSWTLVLGDAKSELPNLLKELGTIDLFLHDSLHTYEHMMFEYSLAYMYLRDGGILMSDDVSRDWSLAFIDVCKAKGLHFTLIDRRLGITKVETHGPKH